MSRKPQLRLVQDFMDQPQGTRAGNRKANRSSKQASRQASRDSRLESGANAKAGEPRWKNGLQPRSQGQQEAIDAVRTHAMTLLVGPAGTGKTAIAVSEAVDALEAGRVSRIVLARPAVEAGERIGFLPGDIANKMDPYMRPLYDALLCRMSPQRMTAWLNDRTIEIAPIGFLRGRTLSECAIVVDEAQNATLGQLQMVTTRLGLGAGSFMVLTGDPTQSDLDEGDSGLAAMTEIAEGVAEGISVVRLTGADVVRHPVVRSLVAAFAARAAIRAA